MTGDVEYTITCVSARLMPPAGITKWWDLYREIVLRLEQTPPRECLRIVLPNGDKAAGAMQAITRLANERECKGHIALSWTVEDGQQVLYARRGPNWSK